MAAVSAAWWFTVNSPARLSELTGSTFFSTLLIVDGIFVGTWGVAYEVKTRRPRRLEHYRETEIVALTGVFAVLAFEGGLIGLANPRSGLAWPVLWSLLFIAFVLEYVNHGRVEDLFAYYYRQRIHAQSFGEVVRREAEALRRVLRASVD